MNANTILKLLFLLCSSVIIGFLLLLLVYSIPMERIITNAKDSESVYTSNIIKEWAGRTRYSHLSNTTDSIRISEAISRPYKTIIENALKNPHYVVNNAVDDCDSLSKLLNNNDDTYVVDYARYWHGYLITIIPGLFLTNAGGLRTISMFLQFLLVATVLYEFGKREKTLMILFSFVILFINPVTTILSFQDADIFCISLLTTLVILKYDNWLKLNNRYMLLFALNGIMVAYFDFLTFPMVAWGLPMITLFVIDKKQHVSYSLKKLIVLSICWVFGYAGMWFGKWILASILTDQNIILDGLNSVLYRTVGNSNSKTYINTLKIIWESINDVPMLLLYSLSLDYIFLRVIKNRGISKISKEKIYSVFPLLLICIGPFAWYFVVRNHSYVHPWMEYRELAVTYFGLLMILYNFFICTNQSNN